LHRALAPCPPAWSILDVVGIEQSARPMLMLEPGPNARYHPNIIANQ
jgi:hypothetical protein